MTEKFELAVIIGNGFDLNIGLKTGYNHFLDTSDDFNNLASIGGDSLFSFLKSKYQSNGRWIDLENALEEFYNPNNIRRVGNILSTTHLASKKKADYLQLVEIIKNYLDNIDIDDTIIKNARNTQAYELIKKLKDKNFVIINFNYTESIDLILTDLGYSETERSKIIKYPHGNLQTEIIIGVEDSASVGSHTYLKKSAHKIFGESNIPKILYEANDVIFFGTH